jgi:hypothetical protein
LAFDKLVRLFAAPEDTLTWHHQVGTWVLKLRPPNPWGTAWLRNLGEGLGPKASLLTKTLRFVELYPPRELRGLEKMGVNWTWLYRSFVVPDKEERHKLLRQGVTEGWTTEDLRFTIQERFPSHHLGIGRKRLKRHGAHGPEVTLHELMRQGSRWKEFFDEVWSKVASTEWDQFATPSAGSDESKEHRLVREASKTVAEAAKICKEIGARLADLL